MTYDSSSQPPTTHPEIFFQVGWRFHLSASGHMIKQGFMLQYVHKSTPVTLTGDINKQQIFRQV